MKLICSEIGRCRLLRVCKMDFAHRTYGLPNTTAPTSCTTKTTKLATISPLPAPTIISSGEK